MTTGFWAFVVFIIIFYLIFSEINKFYIQVICLFFSTFLLSFLILQLGAVNRNNFFFQDFVASSLLFSFTCSVVAIILLICIKLMSSY